MLILVVMLLFFGAYFEVCWLPTRRRDYDRIAKLADLRSDMIFYDLGSGTGDMLFYLSKKFKINCVGIEISPILYLYSKIKSLFYKKVRIKYGNFFYNDLSDGDVIFAFLHPKSNERLRKKFLNNLKQDSKVILASWPFKDLKPSQISGEYGQTTYFLYKKTSLI